MAEEFKSCPDHLVLELEFLSYLYRWGTDAEIKKFIGDHLDWLPLLEEEFKEFHPHSFYRSALRVLIFFLNKEKDRLEVEESGKKEIN
jgi:TorA maturation chaperone TorD